MSTEATPPETNDHPRNPVTFLSDPAIKAEVQKIAKKLGFSEAAVWRHIASIGVREIRTKGLNLPV